MFDRELTYEYEIGEGEWNGKDGDEARPRAVHRQELFPLIGRAVPRLCEDAERALVIPAWDQGDDRVNWAEEKFNRFEGCKALRQLGKENQAELINASWRLLDKIGLEKSDMHMRIATRWIEGRITSDCICEDPWALLKVMADREPNAFRRFRTAMAAHGIQIPTDEELEVVYSLESHLRVINRHAH